MSGSQERTIEEATKQEAEENTIQKVFESNALVEGEDVTIQDVRVIERLTPEQSRPVEKTEKRHDGKLRLSIGAPDDEDGTYNAEEFRSVEPDQYTNTTQFELLSEGSPYIRKEKNMIISTPKELIFDENGEVSGEERVYECTTTYVIEVDVDTPIGEKTLVKSPYTTEVKANQYASDIRAAGDDAQLTLTGSGTPQLRIQTTMVQTEDNKFRDVGWRVVLALLGPAFSILGILHSQGSIAFAFYVLLFLSLVLNTVPNAVAIYNILTTTHETNEGFFNFSSIDQQVDSLDSLDTQTEKQPRERTVSTTVDINDDSAVFNAENEDISWSFDANDGYLSPDAVNFSKHIGIERLREKTFPITIVPNTEGVEIEDSTHLSDCEMWVAQEG